MEENCLLIIKTGFYYVRFHILMVVSMKMTDFRDVAPMIIALMIKAVSTSEMSVNFNKTTWHNIWEDRHFQDFINRIELHNSLTQVESISTTCATKIKHVNFISL
jgi:hypothetical protein